MESVASRLASLMKKRNFNQPQLAEAASGMGEWPVSQQVVQHLLSGRNQNSKHLAAIGRALGTSSDWLQTGKHPKTKAAPESVLVGKVGAGAEITRIEEGTALEGVEAPAGIDAPNAAIISGNSQHPLQEGWRIFYGPEHQGVAEDCMGKLCVVQIKDGPTLLKTLKRGSRRGLFRLESWNAPPRDDVRLAWAARVVFIQPR